jgi:hypothetical protein
MKVIKLYRKPNQPEFYVYVRSDEHGLLVNYPIEVADRKRSARWFSPDEVYVDWIREFGQGVTVTLSPLTEEK